MKKTIALIITLVITLSAALMGCGYKYKELNLRAKFDQSLKGTTLMVYNWGEYISNGEDDSMDTNKEFEKLTGIKVKYLTYVSNETMYSQIKSAT
jgi:spermidine/putrescine transport system substrate-binding protein